MTNPFTHSKTIAFELSNLCNMRHDKCPHSLVPLSDEPVILPRQIILDALAELAEYDWLGGIEFQEYNEPLIDPRLFTFIEAAHEMLPHNNIDIITNGFGLSRQMARELGAAGITKFHVSLYGTDVEREIYAKWLEENIAPIVPVSLGWHALDDRMEIYNGSINMMTKPCYQPLTFLLVHCTGEIGLCCFDWKRTETFGNLNEQPLSDILAGDNAQETYRRLSQGDRFLDICQRCGRARDI